MTSKLSDKEFFIIQAAWRRFNQEEHNAHKGWERVSRATRPKKRRTFWYAAAVVLLCLMAGYGGWRYWRAEKQQISFVQEIQRADGVPVLTLANGAQVFLDTKYSQKEIRQSGALVVLQDSTLSLSYVGDSLQVSPPEPVFNTLTTPKGGEYSLTLSDGTRVWLNAESTLHFPVNFTGGCREVELDGEAYFEVKPDSLHPFYVRMHQTSVEVLGTHFNVSCYKRDQIWRTTLVEGKVKMHRGTNSYVLVPGNQYQENLTTGAVEINRVNVSLYTSWKDGKVFFADERLEDIIGKLARWYDFKIFYADPEIKDLRFGGAINKYNSFNVVLRYLERASGVSFNIEGKTVIARLSGRVN